jgi:Sulfotransferase family
MTAGLGAPVVVLTYPYGGAEQLHAALAAHPGVACTSATGVLPLCEQAIHTWRRVEGRPQEALPGLAAASTRALTAALVTSILARTGAARWCEIAVAPPSCAEAFLWLYPDTKLVLLHRACFSVIDAVVRANPQGLTEPIFLPFAAANPANAAAAVAAYWADRTGPLLAFEQAHPGACLRVRYEDLAAHPHSTASEIFAFAGLSGVAAPTLASAGPGAATARQDGPQPGTTSHGSAIPPGLIPAPLLDQVNDLLTRLGYPLIAPNTSSTPDTQGTPSAPAAGNPAQP